VTNPAPPQCRSTDFCGSPDHPRRTEIAERATWGTKTPPQPPTAGTPPAPARARLDQVGRDWMNHFEAAIGGRQGTRWLPSALQVTDARTSVIQAIMITNNPMPEAVSVPQPGTHREAISGNRRHCRGRFKRMLHQPNGGTEQHYVYFKSRRHGSGWTKRVSCAQGDTRAARGDTTRLCMSGVAH
jgi:hypothetical protein